MPLLTFYRLATIAAAPLARPLLAFRAAQGKEDPERLDERLGFPSQPRPEGRLVWLHGASVGESLSLLPLIERFITRHVEVLVTSGTPASAKVLAARLPAGATHQYLPLDAPPFVERFLGHWRPDLVLFAEAEIWPNLVRAVHRRGAPLVLVNARISAQSQERWLKVPGVAKKLFGMIDLCLAQDAGNAGRFLALGAPRARVAGNLKFDVPAPPADGLKLAAFQSAVGARPVFAAVSIHPGEEQLVLDAHMEMARRLPQLLTLIAPRHPARGAKLMEFAAARGLNGQLRSQVETPRADADVYIVDSVGELGLVFRSAGVVFMGRSLAEGGGHNPIEPAKLGCAILHGPHVEDFSDIYAELNAAKAAARVLDAHGLAQAATHLLSQPARMRKMGRAGMAAEARLGGASREIMTAIEPYLAQLAIERD
jgi:3-deoxy-D-manno-octulosonic-acid transferase